LPLFLDLQKQPQFSWTLKIELSELSDDTMAWTELQRHQGAFVTVNAASSFAVSQRQLLNISCLLEVRPETQPYIVQYVDISHVKGKLLEAPETPGLFDNFKGNVFVQSAQKADLWCRYLPDSTLLFTGTIVWLAKIGCKHEWPGNVQRIGALRGEWLLWQLDVLDDSSVTWQEIKQWFSERGINITPQHQQVELITPPEFVTDDGWYTYKPNPPLLIQCKPPRRRIGGVVQQSYLTTVAFNRDASQLDYTSQTNSESILGNQTSFFSWQPPHLGQYRIRLNGDTTTEPLLISVNSATTSLPQWLRGFSCKATSENYEQTFCAFQSSLVESESDAKYILNQLTYQERSFLTWQYEPEGLPVRITWEYISEQKTQNNHSSHIIRSNAELTTHWQESILPNLPGIVEVKLILDTGSFGLIELTIIPMIEQEEDEDWWSDEQICTQFIWLSRAIEDRNVSPQATMPASLRQTIRQLCEQTQHMPILYRALVRITSADDVPAWIINRLQALLKDVA
jgi:hypothetical protein